MVGTRFELGLSWILPSFMALEHEHPSWHLDTYFGSGDDILARLRSGEMDCIVTSASIASAEWKVHVLHPEEYVLIGAPELIATNPLDDPEHALNHTVLDINSNMPLCRYLAAENNRVLPSVIACFAGRCAHAQLARHGVVWLLCPSTWSKKTYDKGGCFDCYRIYRFWRIPFAFSTAGTIRSRCNSSFLLTFSELSR